MKNTIIIDAKNNCLCDLVSNVDDGANMLFLEIHADVSQNPKLEIGRTNVTIDKNVFLYEIDSSYWVGTGALRFRIVDDAHVCDYFNITKINSLSGNVTLKQVDNFNYALCVPQTEADRIWGMIRDRLYPVGSIYMSVNDVNPSTIYGGTWASWGSGRVPVGVNISDSNFDTVEKTGGEKTHTLTTAEVPSHSHTGGAHAHGLNNHTHGVNITTQGGGQHSHTSSSGANFWVASSSKNIASGKSTGRTGDARTSTAPNHTHLVKGNTGGCSTNTANAGAVDTTKTGGGQAHNNLQPYITCYMWKRTA